MRKAHPAPRVERNPCNVVSSAKPRLPPIWFLSRLPFATGHTRKTGPRWRPLRLPRTASATTQCRSLRPAGARPLPRSSLLPGREGSKPLGELYIGRRPSDGPRVPQSLVDQRERWPSQPQSLVDQRERWPRVPQSLLDERERWPSRPQSLVDQRERPFSMRKRQAGHPSSTTRAKVCSAAPRPQQSREVQAHSFVTRGPSYVRYGWGALRGERPRSPRVNAFLARPPERSPEGIATKQRRRGGVGGCTRPTRRRGAVGGCTRPTRRRGAVGGCTRPALDRHLH
jgi:hypothetical protein